MEKVLPGPPQCLQKSLYFPGYIVSAERGQLRWNLEGLQPGREIKRREDEKKGCFWKLEVFNARECQTRRRSKGKHRADWNLCISLICISETISQNTICLKITLTILDKHTIYPQALIKEHRLDQDNLPSGHPGHAHCDPSSDSRVG